MLQLQGMGPPWTRLRQERMARCRVKESVVMLDGMGSSACFQRVQLRMRRNVQSIACKACLRQESDYGIRLSIHFRRFAKGMPLVRTVAFTLRVLLGECAFTPIILMEECNLIDCLCTHRARNATLPLSVPQWRAGMFAVQCAVRSVGNVCREQ